jgi:hypothetical protein
MKPLYKGLLVAGIHLALIFSLGGKLLYDRATRPRAWARAVPYDPSLPIRGRYVSLQLEVDAPDISAPAVPDSQRWSAFGEHVPTALAAENGRLVARRDPQATPVDAYREGPNAVVFRIGPDGSKFAVLANPVLYFIPEHVQDPSRRPPGEELWVEVTLPKKGPPRPIRLGVKKGDGPVTPLALD